MIHKVSDIGEDNQDVLDVIDKVPDVDHQETMCTDKDAWTQNEVQPGIQRTVNLHTSLSLMKHLHRSKCMFL